ncbi:hypothetical protein D9M68_792470 [compost metagenome]
MRHSREVPSRVLSDLLACLTHPSPPAPLPEEERGDSRLTGRGNSDACPLPESVQKRWGSDPAPSGGRAESLRRGTSGMDAARGVWGHGWPLTPGPRSSDGARGPRRSRGRMQGQAFLVTSLWCGIPTFERSDSPGGETEIRSPPDKQVGSGRSSNT